jgi:hypothetical protein
VNDKKLDGLFNTVNFKCSRCYKNKSECGLPCIHELIEAVQGLPMKQMARPKHQEVSKPKILIKKDPVDSMIK